MSDIKTECVEKMQKYRKASGAGSKYQCCESKSNEEIRFYNGCKHFIVDIRAHVFAKDGG